MKDRLNELIERKGLTATKFAAMIEANPSAISHLLKGRNKPGYDLLVNIAKAFPEISMDWLMTGKGSMYGNRDVSQEMIEDSPKIERVEEKAPVEEHIRETQPVKQEARSSVTDFIPPTTHNKILKRIILFFEDGSFEDYIK